MQIGWMMSRIRYVPVDTLKLYVYLTLNSKLIEQLKVYYTKWKLLSHIKETLSLSADARKPLSLVIHDPLRSTRAPAIPHNQLRLHHAAKGLLDIPSNSSLGNKSFPGPSPNNLTLVPTTSESVPNMVGTSSGTVPLSTSPSHDNRLQVELLARQRVADSVARAKPLEVPRKRRTCCKCAIFGCPGSQKVSNCRNPCRDCNLVSCQGRNPKRLDRKCVDGWH
jgi:hypothetical protein